MQTVQFLVLKVQQAPLAHREQLVHKVRLQPCRGLKVLLVLQAHKVRLVQQVLIPQFQVQQAPQAQLVQLVLQELLVQQAHKVLLAQMVLLVLKVLPALLAQQVQLLWAG